MVDTDQLTTRLARLAAAAADASDIAAAARESRDVAIEDAQGHGFSVREIARITGLSSSAVQGIVVARTAARQARLARTAGVDGPPLPI